jgi:hypothetical protein
VPVPAEEAVRRRLGVGGCHGRRHVHRDLGAGAAGQQRVGVPELDDIVGHASEVEDAPDRHGAAEPDLGLGRAQRRRQSAGQIAAVREAGEATEPVVYDDGLLEGSEHVVIVGRRRCSEVGRALQQPAPAWSGGRLRGRTQRVRAYDRTFAQNTQA